MRPKTITFLDAPSEIEFACVKNRGQGIGRHLMECVLAHYPAGTEFYILTRIFNSDAKNLYQKRLNFSSIELNEIKQLGYDERYCGFRHTTTEPEILDILSRQKFSSESAEGLAEIPQKSFGH